MAEEFTQFIDDSKDKKYFTITPNIIINGYSATESGVYSYIKKCAGENGIFNETQENTAKKLGINIKKYRRILNKLEKDQRIKKIGTKVFKTHPVVIYQITDIWKENVENYKKRNRSKQPISIKLKKDIGQNNLLDIGQNNLPIRTNNKEEPINMSKPSFDLISEIDKLLKDKRRHIQIVGLWIQEKKLNPKNKEQIQSIIQRTVKAAKLLTGYSNEDIKRTIKTLRNTDYIKKFTLETVNKYIDEMISKEKEKGPKILGFKEIKRNGNIVMRPIYEKI